MKDFDSYRIYYRCLLPLDLRRLTSCSKDQKTKRIKLEQFPHKYCDGMIGLLTDFNRDKKKQATLLPNILSMSDAISSGTEFEQFELTIPSASQNKGDIIDQLLNSTPYIYAKPKGVNVSFVVDKLHPEQIISTNNTPIFANGEKLYSGFDIVRKAGGVKEYKVGTDITVSFDGTTMYLNYDFRGTLREQVSEMKLLSALMQGQEVRIGVIPVGNSSVSTDQHSLPEILDRLQGLKDIQNTLNVLHIEKDLNYGELRESDFVVLNQLVIGILKKKPTALSANGKAGVGKITIGNINILLSCKKNECGHGFNIYNFFDSEGMVLTEKGKSPSEGVPISPYVVLSADDFQVIDNICYSGIVDSVKSFPFSKFYGEKIVWLILQLLEFYDTQKSKDAVILNVIEELSDYLIINDPDNRDLYQINNLQAQKRKRTLTESEIKYLMALKSPDSPLQYKLAASILLESYCEAQELYEMMNEEMQIEFDKYPICNLWKTKSRKEESAH